MGATQFICFVPRVLRQAGSQVQKRDWIGIWQALYFDKKSTIFCSENMRRHNWILMWSDTFHHFRHQVWGGSWFFHSVNYCLFVPKLPRGKWSISSSLVCFHNRQLDLTPPKLRLTYPEHVSFLKFGLLCFWCSSLPICFLGCL